VIISGQRKEIEAKDAEIARLTSVIWQLEENPYEPNTMLEIVRKNMYPDECKPCEWPGYGECDKCKHYPALEVVLSKIDTPTTRELKKKALEEEK
jgi:hypothetical protein